MPEKPPFEDLEKKVIDLEKKWRETQSTLAIAQEMTDIGYWSWNIESGEIYWSDQFYRLLGFEPGQIEPSAEKYWELIHPDDLHLEREASKKALATVDGTYEVIHRVIRPDRSVRLLQSRGKIERRSATGKAQFMVGTSQDITALKQTEERYRDLVENTEDLITQTDEEGNFSYVNHTAERIFGFPPDQCIGKSAFQFVHPDDREKTRKWFNQCVKAKRSKDSIENRQVNIKTGEVHSLLWASSFQYDETGRVIGVGGIARDVTSIRATEQNFQNLFEKMLDGFAHHEILCDADGSPVDYRFLRVNPAFEKLTGLKAEKIIGKTVLEVLPGTEKHWIETYGAVALTGNPISFDNYSKDLGKYFEVTAYRPAKNQFACIFQDITPRIKAEEERRAYEAQLRQAQKMEAIGTLSGGIAHDFNNILAAILGYADMAREDLPQWSSARHQIEQVLKAAHRAKELVRQILAFSRKAEQSRRPLQIELLIKETMQFLRATIPTTIEIENNFSPDCGKILADPTQIHQVLMNLCTNAVHAMEGNGGVLSIDTRQEELTANQIGKDTVLKPGPYVMLSVKDTGAGIAQEYIDRIFDPYFTTKEVGKGSGMGLAVVHGIVRSHEGLISVESTPGEGTTFKLYFPRIEEKIEEKIIENRPLPAGRERILIVDDDADIADLTKLRLTMLGYQATAMTSSDATLELFRSAPQDFDLVITDQTMPKMAGDELAKELLKIRPNIPIILCTGFSSRVNPQKAEEIGIKAFLMKPVNKEKLADTVRQVLDQQAKRK